jgi:hypothetical protein
MRKVEQVEGFNLSFANKWLENFWKLNRAMMPLDALDEKMRLITIVKHS